jgi:FKBP-type peptidyl-prolyl cis-trans isomerase SlyD
MSEPTTVEKGVVVTLDYELRLDPNSDDDVFETTEEDGPVEILQGYGQILPALENALYGMKAGEQKHVVIEAEEGFGAYDPDRTEWIPREVIPEDWDLSEGAPIEIEDEETGDIFEAYVLEVGDDSVLVDMNHPLAGEKLHFHVRVVNMRAATAEELAHGHAHGHGHPHALDEDEFDLYDDYDDEDDEFEVDGNSTGR